MATKLFLRNTTTNGITDTGDGVVYDMLTTAGAAVDTDQVTLTAGGTEIQWTQSAGGSTIAWISGRVPAGGFTLTTTDISAWLLESNMNDEAEGRYRVFKYSPGPTITELGGGPFDDGAELGTTITEMTWTGNVTDTAFAENDRILLRLYATNFTTMTAGTADLQFNAADGATGDSFFNIAETVAFKAEVIVNSGALSAAGAATATAAGAAKAAAALSSAGASTATLEGATAGTIESGALSSAGAATATASGASITSAAMSAAGASTATATGAATQGGALSAAGAATATAAGAATAGANLSAACASTAILEAQALATAGAMVSAGAATATAAGASIAAAALSSAGSATAELEGEAVGGTPAPAPEEATPPVSEGAVGAMWTRNPWADQKRKKRKQDEIDELDLLVIGQAAAQQLAADHLQRVTGG